MSRNIIVTGGFGILGSCVASAFAAQGDKVARIDYAAEPREAINGTVDFGGVDLTDFAAAQKVAEKVTGAFGSIDVLVNIAGGFVWQTLDDGGIDTWNRMFAMNAATCVNMTKAALPYLRKAQSARIVNIGANGAKNAAAGMGGYAASKAAVHRLTESLAEELRSDNITVNAILPSVIDTPTNRSDMPDANFADWVGPEAIADAILFVASSSARAISGALIPVTRGGA